MTAGKYAKELGLTISLRSASLLVGYSLDGLFKMYHNDIVKYSAMINKAIEKVNDGDYEEIKRSCMSYVKSKSLDGVRLESVNELSKRSTIHKRTINRLFHNDLDLLDYHIIKALEEKRGEQ